ncbi:CHAT domain-containing protein [Suillus lakei]|nr:CHAT domain-containing protein [Suillus lakei]
MDDDPYHPAALFNLATAKFVSFRANGTHPDLDISITLFQNALDLRPTGHPDRTITQLHLAIALFAKRGSQMDAEEDDPRALNEVISLHYDALRYYNTMHARRGELLCNLSLMLITRFERRGNDEDLDQAILLQREALVLHPVGHADRTISLNNLAGQLFYRFNHRGNNEDLDQAIALHREVLALRPVGHTDRSASLNNLANGIYTRFNHQGNDEDLDRAIALQREALVLRSVGHTHRSSSLNNLASYLSTRFNLRGNDEDLDNAIALQREALALCPVGHTGRSMSLNNLATQLSNRFNHRSNGEDLDQAIALHREALALCPVGHTDRSLSLNNLAAQLATRFNKTGNDEDLDQAITLQREALALRPIGHTHRSSSLYNLAIQLSTRFDHRGNDEDLDQAIALQREALALCPVGHTDRSSSLNNLATQLSNRFNHRGNDEDLDNAIALRREALALRPVGHTGRSMSLNNLATQLSTRFNHRGNGEDLDQAIALQREALALCPVGHTDRPLSLNNLAAQFAIRFDKTGNDEDLDQAILLQREALVLHPVGHTDRSSSLSNLASHLSTRFDHRGNDEDLDNAIALQREALALCPVGHTDRSMSLDNLATQLTNCFNHRGNDEDLDQAIALQREALALLPVGHTHRSISLNHLANQIYTRFDHRGNGKDLDDAIALQREALALRPVGHTHRSESLNNLAAQLANRFDKRGNGEDLDDAIALQKEALALLPVGHTNHSASLNNLAVELSIRYDQRGNIEDLNESRDILRCTLTLLTPHDPRRLQVHRLLADVYLLFHRSGLDGDGEDTDSLIAAMNHLKAAANAVSGGLLPRLKAGLRWVQHASQHSHDTELEAHATSMQLLDAYNSVIASLPSRHHAMKDFSGSLAVDAASCALRGGDVCRAVELLEQGRTVIWTQMTRLRTPLDSLQTHGDHAGTLMKRFRDLSSLLDKYPTNHADGTPRIDVEAAATRYRRLVEDWNRVVEEIRKIEGFSRFLLPPLFSDLQGAACDGPIIVLIASKSSCDAIIIPNKQPPTSIQLPTNLEKLHRLTIALHRASQQEASPKGNQPALTKALRELWDDVVCPVVKKLNGFAPRDSRIWWCPTSLFNFLPLHAAGEYRAQGKSLSQQYISSYTPSLTALMKARGSHNSSPSVPFAAIGQNHPAGYSSTLDFVEPELELVRSLLPHAPTVSFTKITSIDATKSRALRALQDNTWLHFACHGTQNCEEPFQSAFLMRDHPLPLLDIAQLDLSRHEFAFLSACETAIGVPSTPDEMMHLAAGLQFAGVKSVVGTLWKVNDDTVQRLVTAFYKNFCGDGTMDSKRAAQALRQAVRSLACDKDMPLDQRIVFMHIGV